MNFMKRLLKLLDNLVVVAMYIGLIGLSLMYWFGKIVIAAVPYTNSYIIHFN